MAVNISVAPQISLAFEYDWEGRRIRKQVYATTNWTGSATNDVEFVYDGWNLVSELNTSHSALRTYLWGLDLSGPAGAGQGAGGVGGLLAIADSTLGSHFAAFDGNGNLSALLKPSDGSMSADYEYSPFGELVRSTGLMAKGNPLRFSAKYQDDETDLVYYGYRYYETTPGSWLTRDPFEEKGGFNLYDFISNDPVNHIDVLGLQSNVISIPAMVEAGWDAKQIAEVAGISILMAEALVEAYRERRCGKWSCFAKGDVVPIGNTKDLPDHAYGYGTGPTETDACQAAKKMAANLAPKGSYVRHIRCFNCKKY
jgi:RHS repeat-associated protein